MAERAKVELIGFNKNEEISISYDPSFWSKILIGHKEIKWRHSRVQLMWELREAMYMKST